MSAHRADAESDLKQLVAELEQKLQSSLAERDEFARENARLLNVNKGALDRQNASAEILRAIASAPGDAERSLQQIAETTARLFGAPSVSIQLAENGEWTNSFRFGASAERVRSAVPLATVRIGGPNLPGTVVAENRQIHIPDLDHLDPAMAHWPGPPHARAAGTRTMCGTPLRREGKAIGVLIVYRDRLAPFTVEELALLQSFADQAVIAIENARLFNEVQAKTRELVARNSAYSEQIEHQSATIEILKAMSGSQGEAQPVFDVIVRRAVQICNADIAVVLEFDGTLVHLRSISIDEVSTSPEIVESYRSLFPQPPSRASVALRAIFHGQIIHIPNMAEDGDLSQASRDIGRKGALAIPLLRNDRVIGSIGLSAKVTGGFSEAQIELLKTFAEQAVIAIRSAETFRELNARTRDLSEALEQQTATSEVLAVISRSPSDLNPVLEAISDTAARLCGSEQTMFFRYDGAVFRILASWNFPPEVHEMLERRPLMPGHPSAIGRAGASLKPVCIPDVLADPDYGLTGEQSRARYRATLAVPLLREGRLIGALSLNRSEPGAFTEKQIELVATFADQAVIAIENTRLFNETQEALERQTATAEILKVIASSPSDVQPVFDAIATSSKRLIGAFSAVVFRFVDGVAHVAAFTSTTPAADQLLKASFPRPVAEFPPFARAHAGGVVQVPDTEAEPDARMKQLARARGFRSVLNAPLMSKETPLGLITVTRKDPGSFADHHIQLLQTFADQAVIAIENTRLFNETEEALAQQMATSEVLRVISNSVADTAPVFEKILESCENLFATEQLGIFLVQPDGQTHVGAWRGAAFEAVSRAFPRPVEQTATGLVIQNRAVLHIPNTAAMQDVPPAVRAVTERIGDVSMAWAPMLGEERGVGAISVMRQPPNPFSEKELALLKTFADQAVIAIQNTRLFNETQEALERQTATADILKVIASSPSDVQPVFEAIAASANRLIGGFSTAVLRFIDGMAHLAAFTPTNPADDAVLKSSLPAPTAAFKPFELAARGEPTQIADTEAFADERLLPISRARGYRSVLYAPLMNGSLPIGLIGVTRVAPGTFAPHHVQLLQTFADQAVIAIENVRLFNETQEALERQTATADILKVIASSPDDVQPVFEAIAERSNRLVNGLSTAVFSVVDDAVHLMSFTSVSAAADAALKAITDVPLSAFPVAEAMRKGEIAHVADTEDEATPDFLRDVARLRGWRSSLTVPMLREGILIGIIAVTRVKPGLFDDHHVQLLNTFADQAVIAISNVGLFNEVQDRTRELSQSLDDLRAAQDRLVQTEKLASLGQLTAGIAHEIKNPLNFVNNFSALSAELTGELNDVLEPAALTEKMREEVDELTKMLRDNLEKVVQHGKRADSIVKNMLLHSREGSREQRTADINALLDESLNLAYHGARAEKPQFNVTLQRDFDADAGAVELFPQEITRAFLNLISNGFYAVTKRKTENGSGFEPVLSASTKNLGSTVEIRIRDNGTGIPPEVKEKMFNPFFTTKPAGEGTGLGLSMSHDIIVKQHGGTIDVETEPGQFTEFTIVLPRTSNSPGKTRGQS